MIGYTTTVHRIGVCSWSLRPTGPEDLVRKLCACGIGTVQLALDPLRDERWALEQTIDVLTGAGITIASGMMAMKGEDYSTLDSIRATGGVRSDVYWSENLEAAAANAEIAAGLSIPLVTFHAGFLPHGTGDALRGVMIERIRDIGAEFAVKGVRVALETGQESAATLGEVLSELHTAPGSTGSAAVGVNFDPANMILYGMGDPVAALDALSPHVAQVHIKDARPAALPGAWGQEVRVGTGAVDWSAFLRIVQDRLPGVGLMIEREAREDRVEDIRAGAAFLRAKLGSAALISEVRT